MKLSCKDRNFIESLLNFEDCDVCECYRQAEKFASRHSENLKLSMSPHQLSIYDKELVNREEMEHISKLYYFFMGLKTFAHITTIVNNPSEIIEELFSVD